MRLGVVESGHRPFQKLPLLVIRALVGHVPGPILVMSYRKPLFGSRFSACMQEGMRNGSSWTNADRELFAAFVSKINDCAY